MTTHDIHKDDVAATESDEFGREDYCRMVGSLVGNITSTVEPLGPAVVNALAETPGAWETMLGHIVSGYDDAGTIARQFAAVLRRHSFSGVAVAGEQCAYRLGYFDAYVSDDDKRDGAAMLAEFFIS